MAFQYQPVKPPQAPGAPVAPKPQVNPYNVFRQQAEQRAGAQMQDSRNALQRRFAQLGGGPSGAQMKMEQEVQRQGADDLNNQLNAIGAQEAQAGVQANQFDRQFGLEQTKALAGLDLARRDQLLNEQGQLFNQVQADPWNAARTRGEIQNYQYMLNNDQGANNFGSYLQQIQNSNPMLRRFQIQAQPPQGAE